jgi:predicted ester cyclase
MGLKGERLMKTKSIVPLLALLGGSLSLAAPATAKKQPLRTVMDRFFEAVDSKDPARMAAVDAPDLVMVTPMGTFRGIAGHTQLMQGFATAFPNFKHQVSGCLESGEQISCEGTFTGDHTGPLTTPNGQTVPPTKKQIDMPWGGFATIKNGKVASVRVYFDPGLMMRQLGLMK